MVFLKISKKITKKHFCMCPLLAKVQAEGLEAQALLLMCSRGSPEIFRKVIFQNIGKQLLQHLGEQITEIGETEKYQRKMFTVLFRSGNSYFGFSENFLIIPTFTTCNFTKHWMSDQIFSRKFHKTFKKTYFSKYMLTNASSAFYLFIARLYQRLSKTE